MQDEPPPTSHKLLLPRVMNNHTSPPRPSLTRMMQFIQQKRNEYEQHTISHTEQSADEERELEYLKKAEMDEDDPMQAILQPNIYRVKAEEKLCAGTQREQTVHGKTKKKRRILMRSIVGAAFTQEDEQQTSKTNTLMRYRGLNSQATLSDLFTQRRDTSGTERNTIEQREQTGTVEDIEGISEPSQPNSRHLFNESRIMISDTTHTGLVADRLQIKLPPTPHKRTQPDIIIEESPKTELKDEAVQTLNPVSVNKSAGQSRQRSLRTESGTSSQAIPSSIPKYIKKSHARAKTESIQPLKKQSRLDSVSSHEGQDDSFDLVMYSLKGVSKNPEKIQRAVMMLERFNPFFRKLPRLVGVCLLKIGRLHMREQRSIIYQMGDSCAYFIVILKGKVKLKNRYGNVRECQAGETLLEQVLPLSATATPAREALERAKVVERSWLLEVKVDDLGKLEGELLRFGLKQSCTELWTLLKRNHIVKTWLRNKLTNTYRP